MRAAAIFLRFMILIFIRLRIAQSQQPEQRIASIRGFRCPPAPKRYDCPTFVWDECTCDLDCPGERKCCMDGCRHACLETTIPSVRNKADVVFMMDSSGSIGTNDYNREKKFVKDLSDVFRISPNETRVSTIIYSDFPKLVFDFDTLSSNVSIKNAIDNLEFLGQRTRIDKALALAKTVFSKSRPSVPRIAFVLTDGAQTEDWDAKPLDIAVRPLHDLGVQVYVVGIGSQIKKEELYLLTRRRNDVFFVDSFERLLQQTYRIVNQIDTYDLLPPLDITADMLFLVDSSSAVVKSDYQKELDFLKKIVELFRISPRYVRVGIITYGNRAELSIPLGLHSTNEAIKKSIDSLPYIGGTKRIDRALTLANLTFSQARPLVPKIVLILTHEGQVTEPGADLRTPVRALQAQGVTMFVIAIGENVDYLRLNQIVPRINIISDKSHEALEPYLPSAASYIRVNSDFSTPLRKNAAVVFLIDSSINVEKNDFKRQREFVISLAKAFKIPENGARASVITYGRFARPSVQFKDSADFARFRNSMLKTSIIGGARRMDKALRLAVRMFRDHVRPGPRAVVLFTSGPQNITESVDLDGAVKQLELLRARIYVIAIGNQVRSHEVRSLVNSSDDVIKIPSFFQLMTELHAIGRHIVLTHDTTKRPAIQSTTQSTTTLSTTTQSTTTQSTTQTTTQPIRLDKLTNVKFDIIFLMDSSSNVPFDEYRKEKDFVKVLARHLNVSPGNSRAAVVTYGNRAAEVIGFDIQRSVSAFETAVDNSPYINGNSRIDRSLNKSAQIMDKARPLTIKVVVLLTAGKQSSEFGSQSPAQAAKPLRERDVYIYVVTIGLNDISELRPVVQHPSHIFRMVTYDDLKPRSRTVGQIIIDTSTKPAPITDIDADIIFLMDSSYDVTQEDYAREKTFVKDMARYLDVSSGRSRASVITYGKNASLLFKFGEYGTLPYFDRLVDRAEFVGGGRRTDLALEEAGRLLTETRTYKAKWVILLTSGPHPTTPDVGSLVEASKPVRDLSDKIYVVAISNRVNIKELRDVVADSKDIFSVLSFQSLKPQTMLIADAVVKGHVNDSHVIKTFIADIVFLVDTSSLVGTLDFTSQRQFVKFMAKSLNVGPEKSRAAIITYGGTSSPTDASDMHSSLSAFGLAVDGSRYISGPRKINNAVDSAVTLFGIARPNVKKVVVLLTGGKQSYLQDVPLLKQSFKNMRASGAKAYIIAIGSDHEKEELLPGVESPQDIFAVASFESLVQQAWQTSQEIAERTVRDFQADVLFIMDSSGEVSRDDYIKEKDFVASLAKYLRLSPTETRAALLTYGYTAMLVANYDSYDTLPLFTNAVKGASYISGSRRIDKALDYALQLVPNARKLLPKIVVLFTAGRQALGYPLDVEAKKLQDQGAKTYIVAIGDKPNVNELLPIVEDQRDVFRFPSFDDLQQKVLSVAYELGNQPDPKIPVNFQGADILFIVDSSAGVSPNNYEMEKELVKNLIKVLNSPQVNSRTAFITYGNTARVVYDLDNDMDAEELQRAIDSAQQMGGGRRTDRALDKGLRIMKNSRGSAPKIVLLITAGRQILEEGVRPLSLFGRALREINANSFVLGIGGNVSKQELTPVVRDAQEDVFTVNTFKVLTSVVGRLAYYIVQRTLDAAVPETDIVFVMDSSSEVTQSNYRDEKKTVKAMARSLQVPSGKSRASVITYGSYPFRIVRFNSYRTFSALENAIDRAPTVGGGRRIDLALQEAVRLLSEARPSSRKSVILFTSGRTDPSSRDLYEAAKPIFEQNAVLFIISISGRPNVPELTAAVKKPEDVFNVSSFTNLEKESVKAIQSLVQRRQPRKYSNFTADIIFLVDSSLGVSRSIFNREKDFVRSMVRSLDLSPGKSRVAVVSYGDRPDNVDRFSSSSDVEAVATEVDNIRYVSGRRNISQALEYTASLLSNARPSVAKVMILLTAGSELYLTAPSQTLKGANRYVIALGADADQEELTPIIDDPRDLFAFGTPQELTWETEYLISEIVKRTRIIYPTTPPSPTTTSEPTATTTSPEPTTTTTSPEPTTTTKPIELANVTADIVFLVDTSSDVSPDNYKREKDFVASLARQLNFGSGKSRVAVVLYNNDATIALRFDVVQNPEFLQSILDGFVLQRRGRRIDKALVGAALALGQSRQNVRKIVILLTAGQLTQDLRIVDVVKRLKAVDAERFVVAIGPQVSREKLRPVVERNEDVLFVKTFDGLKQELVPIADHILKGIIYSTTPSRSTTTSEPTRPTTSLELTTTRPVSTATTTSTTTTTTLDFKADVVFLIDTSFGVTLDEFDKEKEFIKQLSAALNHSPQGSRVAILLYASYSRIASRLGIIQTSELLASSLDGLTPLVGLRRMDRALEYASTAFDNKQPDVRKVVVLLTAGPQSRGGKPLDQAVQPLRTIDAELYVVGIGSRVKAPEITSIVKRKQDVFIVPTFNGLISRVKPIADYIIHDSQPAYKNSVIFLVDASFGVTQSDFIKEKDFVKSIARSLQLPLEDSKMAVVPYGSFTGTSGGLNSYQSLNEFDGDIDAMQLLSGSRRMEEALKAASKMLQQDRSTERNIIILLTAGRQASGYRGVPLTDAGKDAMDAGAEIYVVAIGSKPSFEDLRPVVAVYQNIYQVGSFDYLQREAQPIGKDISVGDNRPFDVTADIVFMVDSSASVGSNNYQKEKEFVKFLARLVNITSENTRIAVIVYNSSPSVVVQFGDYKSIAEFDELVDNITLLGGSYRRMDLALELAARLLISARSNVSKIAVLLTAGRQLPGGISLDTATEGLRNLNATTLVVAIGQQYNKQELSPVVTAPEDLFELSSFDELALRARTVGQAIEDKSAPKPENMVADVVFLVDSSSSVTSLNFLLEKKFVKAMARSLNVSPDKSRSSVIVYGSKYDVVMSLQEFTNLDDFKRAVHRASYIDGPRRMDLALEATASVMKQGRSNVRKVVVLLTSGRQSPTDILDPLSSAVKPLRSLGIQTYVVSIGSEPDNRELTAVVDDSRNIIEVPSFEALSSQTTQIAKAIATIPETPVHNITTEVVFALDASSEVGTDNFNRQKAFVKLLARSLNVASGKSRAALIVYSTNAVTVKELGDYKIFQDFERTLDEIYFYGGEMRRIDRALEEAVGLFKKARPGVQRKVILLTGGRHTPSDDKQALDKVKKRLLEAGALPFIVALGNDHDFPRLITAVDDQKDIFKVPSFEDLLSQVKSTAAGVASRTITPPLRDEYIVFLLDSSSTVGPEKFKKQKDFIKPLAKYLNVGSTNKTKAAVINYGRFPFTSVKFDDSSNLREFEDGVDRMTPRQGSRRIDRALDEAAGILKKTDPLSSKIVVLLTTGRQARESDVTPFSVLMKALQDMGTRTYVIAIGSEPITRELKPLVNKTQDIFRVLFDMMEREVPCVVGHIRKENPRPGPKNDFVFLMDSSSDVTRLDFTREIIFVKSFARELCVSPSEFQAAVIAYGNRYSPMVRFGSYSSLTEFFSTMDSSVFQGGARRMDRALEAASIMLSSRNPESRKTVVLITGGRNSQEAGANSLKRSVQRLSELGAEVIVVAFGNRFDAQELLPIVGQQQDIHPVQSSNDLVPYVSSLATYVISKPSAPVKQHQLEAEVVFVIDSSYEVTQEDYKKQKEFIKSLVRDLDLSSNRSRAALITYGDRGALTSRFIGLKNLDALDKSIDNASYVGGDRRIDKGLKMVARALNEAEATTTKLVIFLTAGKQASSGGSLGDAVQPIRQFGAKTFVIAIGKKPDVQELRPLVASPENVVTVVSFKELKSQTTRVASHIRENAVVLNNIVDVVFLVDSSNSVNSINFIKEKAFVKLLAKRLNVSPGKSRAAVIAYGSISQLGIDFDDYDDLPVFETLVDGIPYINGTRRIDKALEAAADVLKNSRRSMPKIVILLTSGLQPKDAPSLAASAGALHALGAMVYVVSIANDLGPKDFELLVDHTTHVSQVSSFNVLNNTLPQVIRGVEQGVTSRKQVNADVVFLMDASTTGSSRYFQSQKDLIKSIMRNLGTSTDKLRASLILYNSSTSVLADLRSYTTLQRFEDAVDGAKYLTGIRRIDKALSAAAQQLSQSRSSAAKIVILITTGRQAQVFDMIPLSKASQPLRDANVNILVIGIGKQPDIRELNLITRNPKDVQIIPSPEEVVVNVHLLSRQLRQEAITGQQSALIPRADLIFLLDSSFEVTSTLFKQQKDFIKSIVERFQIGANKTRAVVIRYSSSASAIIDFNSHDNLLDLLRGIENIRYLPGDRRLDAALKEANKIRERARADVPTYVIILTAGRQAITSVPTPLDRAAQPLLDSSTRVIVVGIGSQPDDKELHSMVERDRDVFRFSPDELQYQAHLLVVYMASQAGTPLPRDFKADYLFLVDSSQTISKEKFVRELEFVKAFARTLDIAPDKSRVSVMTFGDTPILSIPFGSYKNIQSLLRGIDAVPYISGEKRLDDALSYAARIFSKTKDRPDANKFLVVVTDGKQPLGRNPLGDAAKPLYQIGVKVIVVGAGENVNMGELGKVTSKPDNLFYSRTFDVLVRQVPFVTEHVMISATKTREIHGLFLVDSSGYRTASEFAAQIDFIKSIAKRLDVSPNGTRAGVILYDSDPQLRIGLDDYSTFSEFYTLLSDLSLQSGGRELHKALKIAADTLQNSPEAIPKFLVVFVEGRQYGLNGIALLSDAVKPLQALGVTVFVVGIGNRLNNQELVTMTEKLEHVVNVTSFAELLQQVERLSKLIDSTTMAPCKATLDVGFVVDASGSMGLDNFSREKNFVKLVSRRFANFSPETRLGLISFSDTAKLFIGFGEFERMSHPKRIDHFQKIVDELPYHGGRSRIDRALMAASEDLFTNRRPGVFRVLVLVSDGRQSKDPDSLSLVSAVKPLRGQRVKVLAVGFGENVNTQDLTIVTGSADNILSEKAVDDVDKLQRELVSKACKI